MIHLPCNRLDEERTGDIVLATPSMKMLEIIVFNRALDVCAVEVLNMEGGRTGRQATFRASAMGTA